MQLLTIPEAAKLLRTSENHIYRLIRSGELRAVDVAQPGARRSKQRIRPDDLDAYVNGKTAAPAPASALPASRA